MWPIALYGIVGAAAGTIFGVQTVLLLALIVLIEAVCEAYANGVIAGLVWGGAAEAALQFGYLLGGLSTAFLRAFLSRWIEVLEEERI